MSNQRRLDLESFEQRGGAGELRPGSREFDRARSFPIGAGRSLEHLGRASVPVVRRQGPSRWAKSDRILPQRKRHGGRRRRSGRP